MTIILKAFGILLLLWSGQITIGQTVFNYKDDFNKVLTKTKDQNSTLAYDKLLKRFCVNDTTLTDFEILALLIGFTDKPEYRPYADLSTESEIYNLNAEKKYKEALELGQVFIKSHPLSVRALFEIAHSFNNLNQEDSARHYHYRVERIFRAMFFSGKGLTKETPIFALGPNDGQDYVKRFIGVDIGSLGSGRDKNGDFLDILEARFKDGRTMDLYFIIQHAFDKMIDGKSIEEIITGKKKNN